MFNFMIVENRSARAPMAVAVERAAPPVVEAGPLRLVVERGIGDCREGAEALVVSRRFAAEDDCVYGCGEHCLRFHRLQHYNFHSISITIL